MLNEEELTKTHFSHLWTKLSLMGRVLRSCHVQSSHNVAHRTTFYPYLMSGNTRHDKCILPNRMIGSERM